MENKVRFVIPLKLLDHSYRQCYNLTITIVKMMRKIEKEMFICSFMIRDKGFECPLRWRELAAGEVAKILEEEEGWKRTTTYTMLQKCIDKGYVRRSEKGFRCRATMTREEAQMSSVSEQIEKSIFFKDSFFHSIFKQGKFIRAGDSGITSDCG